MAARTFVIARGRIIELAKRVSDGINPINAGFFVAYYTTIEVNATLEAHTTKTSVDAGGNTECTFTNYGSDTSRLLTNVSWAVSSLEVYADSDNFNIVNAGGAFNETIVKAILFYTPDSTNITDITSVPLCHYQFDVTTSGVDLTFAVPTAGLYRTG